MQSKTYHIGLILSLFILVSGCNANLDTAAKSDKLLQALNLIVQKIFLKERRPLYFFVSFDNKSRENYFKGNDLINGMLHGISNVTYNIFYDKRKKFINKICNEVILLDNFKAFRDFYSKMRFFGSMDSSKIVLYVSSVKTVDDRNIYFMFQNLYHMEMIRVVLVVRLANDDIVMFSYFPFTYNSCRRIKPVLINKYLADQSRWENNIFFSQRLRNFFGCPIYCCAWEEMPFFGVAPSSDNVNDTNYLGLYGSILKYAAVTLNFTVKIHWIKPIRDTSSRLLSQIFWKNCDLALGHFTYEKDPNNTLTFSQTNDFMFSHIYIVTNVINSRTTYEKLAFPFHYTVWFALGLTFALSSLLICICGLQRRWSNYRNFLIGSANKTPQLHVFALAVGGNMTATHMPKRNFARFLIICWLLLTFILRNAYQSGMYQMLRDNNQWSPPQTIEDVLKQGYLIAVTPENQKYLRIMPDVKRLQVYDMTTFELFEKLLEAKQPIATVVPYQYFGHFGLKNSSQWQRLHLVPERLLTQQLTIYTRHNSYIIPILNKKLSYALFHGFISRWMHQAFVPSAAALKHGKQAQRKLNKDTEKKSLSLKELGAIFMILVWLHIFASAVFLIELAWHRYGSGV